MSKKGKIASTPIPGTKQSVDNQRFVSTSNKSRAQSRANRLALVTEFQNSMTQPMPYKPAKLYSANGDLTKEWYVEYFFQVPGDFLKYKRFKVRFNLNRERTLSGRMGYGKDLERFWNEKLRNGFNPFMAFQVKDPTCGLTILKQLEYILNELCEGETKSAKHTFNSHYNRFEKYVEESSLTDMSLAYFGKGHCEGYKTWMKKKNLSRKTINSSLSYMSRFFKLGIKQDWLVDNHMKNVEQIKEREYRTDVAKRERFDPINGNEMDAIFTSLKEKKEEAFIAFLAMIYYAWIRPVEISRLRIGDIDLKRSIIKLKKNDTKNNMGAHVQIVPPLLAILKKIDFSIYSSSNFLFSKNNLLPGAEPVSKNFCGEKWKQLVKVGLKIDKDMYALKHTGNIEYLLNNKGNTDLKWQQSQNRHKTSSMTDLYNRKLGAYFIEVGQLNYRHFD